VLHGPGPSPDLVAHRPLLLKYLLVLSNDLVHIFQFLYLG
jgi:hypothetical protein